jgi:hypothetical protein
MMTSIATAKALMIERRGRWTRLPRMSLFIEPMGAFRQQEVYANGAPAF